MSLDLICTPTEFVGVEEVIDDPNQRVLKFIL